MTANLRRSQLKTLEIIGQRSMNRAARNVLSRMDYMIEEFVAEQQAYRKNRALKIIDGKATAAFEIRSQYEKSELVTAT